MKIFFGIDIGGTLLKCGAFSENGELLQKWQAETDLSEGGGRIIPQIGKEVRSWMACRSLTDDEIGGVGLGIPGPVDGKGYVKTCVNLNWKNFYPSKELAKEFPRAVIAVGNDANVAALGEYVCGAGKRYASAMLITVGTGIGGGIILDGAILSGAHGIAGEIGHITTDAGAKERCSCGNLGCVDHISSATGIVRNMRDLLEREREKCVLREKGVFTAKDVCDGAGEGDPLCIKCLDQCMEPLGKAMAFFSHAFDPEVYMIGGGVSKAGEVILQPLRKYYRENLYLTDQAADIRTAQLGNDAGMIGCAFMAIQQEADKKAGKL